MQSYLTSHRKITKANFVFYSAHPFLRSMDLCTSVIVKFSATLTSLKLACHPSDLPVFIKILSLVPNIEHLTFESLSSGAYFREQMTREHPIHPSNEILNLHHLKTLKFIRCNHKFMPVLNRLPIGILTELQFSELGLHREVNVLFERQRNIKKLSMTKIRSFDSSTSVTLSDDFLDNLNLELLVWRENAIINNIAMILSKQTNLKSLELLDKVDGGCMKVIANQMPELETLSINVFEVPVAAFVNIRKLKKLKALELHNVPSVHHFISFVQFDNSRITTLNLRNDINMPIHLISVLAKSVPNLKVFRFDAKSENRILTTVMSNFNFVEFLQIGDGSFFSSQRNDDTDNLIGPDCVNPRLIELFIKYKIPYETSFLDKLISSYPNLKKLVIESSTPLTVSPFKLIFDGFTKIQSLTLLSGASKLTTDDLNCLKDHQNTVKFVSLKDFNINHTGRLELELELKKNLGSIFYVIDARYCVLRMAVDNKTMNREDNIVKDSTGLWRTL